MNVKTVVNVKRKLLKCINLCILLLFKFSCELINNLNITNIAERFEELTSRNIRIVLNMLK